MATDTGCWETAFMSESSSLEGTSLKPSMATARWWRRKNPHFCSLATYSQPSSVSMPRLLTIHSNPLSIKPPLHPMLPFVEHEMSSSSDREMSLPVLMALTPSTAPVVENAQHDPHCFWFLTGVTAPLATQSISSGGVTSAYSQVEASTGARGARRAALYPSIFLNSSLVRSARWFKPTKWVCSPFSYSALCFWTNSWLSAKIFRRSSFSSSESYVLPCFCVHSWKRLLSDPTSFVAFSPSAALSWLILAAAAWRSCLSWRVSEGTMRAAVAPGRATSSSMSAARKRITRRVIATFRFGNYCRCLSCEKPGRGRGESGDAN
mmetsp:Transcript_10728/g.41913  ORF Transcript_10728/g.41913 Transcript_10728/m.41913 type:complete len:321 (-) Transcript_10728:335-1297(-)